MQLEELCRMVSIDGVEILGPRRQMWSPKLLANFNGRIVVQDFPSIYSLDSARCFKNSAYQYSIVDINLI